MVRSSFHLGGIVRPRGPRAPSGAAGPRQPHTQRIIPWTPAPSQAAAAARGRLIERRALAKRASGGYNEGRAVRAGGGTVDTLDLKSKDSQESWGFDSPPAHQMQQTARPGLTTQVLAVPLFAEQSARSIVGTVITPPDDRRRHRTHRDPRQPRAGRAQICRPPLSGAAPRSRQTGHRSRHHDHDTHAPDGAQARGHPRRPRPGRRPRGHKARRTPLRALRKSCLWCCLDQPKEVRLCPATSCPLWPWRPCATSLRQASWLVEKGRLPPLCGGRGGPGGHREHGRQRPGGLQFPRRPCPLGQTPRCPAHRPRAGRVAAKC